MYYITINISGYKNCENFVTPLGWGVDDEDRRWWGGAGYWKLTDDGSVTTQTNLHAHTTTTTNCIIIINYNYYIELSKLTARAIFSACQGLTGPRLCAVN